jgi:hypothetical protein
MDNIGTLRYTGLQVKHERHSYGYCVGVFSSRKIARVLYEDVAFRVLSGGEQPHFTASVTFAWSIGRPSPGLFLQVLKLCQRAGLVKLGEARLRAEIDALMPKPWSTHTHRSLLQRL